MFDQDVEQKYLMIEQEHDFSLDQINFNTDGIASAQANSEGQGKLHRRRNTVVEIQQIDSGDEHDYNNQKYVDQQEKQEKAQDELLELDQD